MPERRPHGKAAGHHRPDALERIGRGWELDLQGRKPLFPPRGRVDAYGDLQVGAPPGRHGAESLYPPAAPDPEYRLRRFKHGAYARHRSAKLRGRQQFDNQFEEREDVEKIKDPVITIDRDLEKDIIETANMVFAGIAPGENAGHHHAPRPLGRHYPVDGRDQLLYRADGSPGADARHHGPADQRRHRGCEADQRAWPL